MNRDNRFIVLVSITILVIVIVLFLEPFAQDQDYHNFADQRRVTSINNFNDVVSNIGFILFGLYGLSILVNYKSRLSSIEVNEMYFWIFFFCGSVLTGVGSAYYHLQPNNETLFWDRLPMTLLFMSIFSFIIYQRIDKRVGLALLPILIILGVISVVYWNYSESINAGDLRFYVLVQFLPMLLLPIILYIFPEKNIILHNSNRYFYCAAAFYLLAKISEHFDQGIFTLVGQQISGHTLKHIFAAVAVYVIILYLLKRNLVTYQGYS